MSKSAKNPAPQSPIGLATQLLDELFSAAALSDFSSHPVAMVDEEGGMMEHLVMAVREAADPHRPAPSDEVVDIHAAYAFGFAMGARFGGGR